MSFLYPSFLFGLLAVSVPVIIHLFNFQKPKRVFFTNVKYLKQVNELTNHRLKLKHLLILLCRILLIVFLVLAFAQPLLRGNQNITTRGLPQVFLYLDNSLSMQNEVDGQKALDASIETVTKISELYPPNTKFNLLTNDFEGRDQFLINHDKLNERLTEVDFSSAYKAGSAIHNRLWNIASKTPSSNRHFFFISDFQKSTLGDLSTLPFDSASQYYFFPLQVQPQANIYLDSVWLSNPVVHVRENNTIEARISNTGSKDVANLVVKLYMDDVQSGTATCALNAGASQTLSFNFNLPQSGSKKCRLVFDDSPVSFDNKYYFVLDVSSPIKILQLYATLHPYIKNVYANTQTFALGSYPAGNFDYSLIASSDLIILDGLESISESLAKSLQQFLLKGGSLLVFPAANLNVSNYNSFLASHASLLLSKADADTSLSQANATLQTPDFNNPFFKDVFEKTDKTISMPYAFPAISWANRGQRLLTYKTGNPFLSLFRNGNAKVYIAAAPLSAKATNFAQHATFVPVMYKIAFQAAKNDNPLAHSFQEPIVAVDIFSKSPSDVFTLHGDNLKLIPDQRMSAGHLLFSFPEANYKSGFYNLTASDSLVKVLAVNQGKQESLMTFATPQELKTKLKGNKNIHIYADDLDDSLTAFKSDNFGKPLWKQCLIASLIFLLFEILLLRFFR